jgi:hypothetical protein
MLQICSSRETSSADGGYQCVVGKNYMAAETIAVYQSQELLDPPADFANSHVIPNLPAYSLPPQCG